ncbi:ABC transporter substrate-binding protein [Cellulomonas triticagri]|uniref:ABC transporter substrate-binding protein n=1 Tax=Cellulomonas triticagri TaxID=2483352 RepID=UPI0013152982|nr:ABC transporter substrate-binding protein [Cellulomonas triticagri]
MKRHLPRRRRTTAASAAVAVAALLALTACGAGDDTGSGSTGSADGGPQPLVISLDSSVDLLDAQAWRTPAAMVATGSLVEQLIEQTYDTDGLVRTGTTEFEGALAESWEVSEDGLTTTFHLRDGLAFADGTPLTAQDVVWSYQRSLLGPGYVKALLPFAGVPDETGVTAPDDSTVVVTSTFASPLLTKMEAMQPLGVFSQATGEANATDEDPWAGAWFRENANSSGPYTVASYDPTQQLVLEPNEHYYDQDKIANAGVTIQFVSDPSQRALLLRSGEIDLAQGIPLDQVQAMEDEDGLTVVSEASNRLEYLGFNTSEAPFDDPLVRQAVAKAVPYQDLVDQVLYGYANPATGVVPATMETHSEEAGTFEEDLDAAQDLLAEAGLPDGFSSTLYYKQSNAVEAAAAVLVQANLKEIGVDIDLKPLTDADFTSQTNARSLPMYLNNFLGWGADPFYQMYYLAGSAAGTNFTSYANPELDALLQEGAATADEATREQISAEAQQVIYDEMPFIPVYNPNWTFVVRDGVSGLTKDNTEQLRLQYLTQE